jgi:hypothetical protein
MTDVSTATEVRCFLCGSRRDVIRTVVREESLVVIIKGLGAKTNSLAVNHQSQNIFDFDFGVKFSLTVELS